MIMKNEIIEYKENILHMVKLHFSQLVGEFMLQSLGVKAVSEEISRNFLIELEGKILGQPNIQTYSIRIEVPLNWWQHFKQDKFSTSYLKRHPIKTKIITKEIKFNHWALMPKINYKPKENKIVMYTPTPYPKERGITISKIN